jgi:hypothetical protein
MDSIEFISFRVLLDKTQEQLAELIGVSVRAVRSYEQGWRTIPAYVERQMIFLVYLLNGSGKVHRPCYIVKKCSKERKINCPTWQYKLGALCWMINGTICEGTPQHNWQEKITICRSCEVLSPYLMTKDTQ